MKVAIVLGHHGRVGRAFVERLLIDDFNVHGIERDAGKVVFDTEPDDPIYLFDCSIQHGAMEEHLQRVAHTFARHRDYAGIFVPSSWWLGDGSPYGQAKLVIEQMAKFYRLFGANIVTDRIGYFPGEGVEPNPRDPFLDKLVTADDLYERVMKALIL